VAAPYVGAAAEVCERLAPYSSGCGWLSRVASWLECECWYVGMANTWWSVRCGGAARCRGDGPKALAILRALSLSRADNEAAFDAGCWIRVDVAPRRVGFFIYARASRACSSHSSNNVFSLAMVKGQLVSASIVLSLGCSVFLGGLGPMVGGRCPLLVLLYGFAQFSLINLSPSS
jgi:hypothetical protein